MMKKRISSGSTFEDAIGYSRAIVRGDWVFISGTTGYNYDTMTISNDVVDQAEQCFVNIISTLEKANATLSDIVRVTYIFPNTSDFELCWPVFKKYLGNVKPAATMISAGLANTKMKVEIEVTALINS
ncbi:RidA family protein [Seonamhaeicola sp. ML3]|uniref:RidA family protein n=1 Tax=Seonamhaeicola sp. ML3 TaxID=2937786 RepID=UPI00200E6ADE|nr:RidA family protein [Seonamhaeicola sp. ML3]